MSRLKRDRGLAGGREKDQIFLELIKTKAPYEARRQALLKLEKKWLRTAKTDAERRQIQRSISEDLVTLAFSFDQSWAEFGKYLRRVRKHGFSNLALRVHIASLYVQAVHLFPQRAGEAWSMLDDAKRRALRLRRTNPLREEFLSNISRAEELATVPRP